MFWTILTVLLSTQSKKKPSCSVIFEAKQKSFTITVAGRWAAKPSQSIIAEKDPTKKAVQERNGTDKRADAKRAAPTKTAVPNAAWRIT